MRCAIASAANQCITMFINYKNVAHASPSHAELDRASLVERHRDTPHVSEHVHAPTRRRGPAHPRPGHERFFCAPSAAPGEAEPHGALPRAPEREREPYPPLAAPALLARVVAFARSFFLRVGPCR
jgi:hypothetical protein